MFCANKSAPRDASNLCSTITREVDVCFEACSGYLYIGYINNFKNDIIDHHWRYMWWFTDLRNHNLHMVGSIAEIFPFMSCEQQKINDTPTAFFIHDVHHLALILSKIIRKNIILLLMYHFQPTQSSTNYCTTATLYCDVKICLYDRDTRLLNWLNRWCIHPLSLPTYA